MIGRAVLGFLGFGRSPKVVQLLFGFGLLLFNFLDVRGIQLLRQPNGLRRSFEKFLKLFGSAARLHHPIDLLWEELRVFRFEKRLDLLVC